MVLSLSLSSVRNLSISSSFSEFFDSISLQLLRLPLISSRSSWFSKLFFSITSFLIYHFSFHIFYWCSRALCRNYEHVIDAEQCYVRITSRSRFIAVYLRLYPQSVFQLLYCRAFVLVLPRNTILWPSSLIGPKACTAYNSSCN